MNLPSLSTSPFTSFSEYCFVAYENIARKSTQITAKEVCEINPVADPSNPSNTTCRVSIDGA